MKKGLGPRMKKRFTEEQIVAILRADESSRARMSRARSKRLMVATAEGGMNPTLRAAGHSNEE